MRTGSSQASNEFAHPTRRCRGQGRVLRTRRRARQGSRGPPGVAARRAAGSVVEPAPPYGHGPPTQPRPSASCRHGRRTSPSPGTTTPATPPESCTPQHHRPVNQTFPHFAEALQTNPGRHGDGGAMVRVAMGGDGLHTASLQPGDHGLGGLEGNALALPGHTNRPGDLGAAATISNHGLQHPTACPSPRRLPSSCAAPSHRSRWRGPPGCGRRWPEGRPAYRVGHR